MSTSTSPPEIHSIFKCVDYTLIEIMYRNAGTGETQDGATINLADCIMFTIGDQPSNEVSVLAAEVLADSLREAITALRESDNVRPTTTGDEVSGEEGKEAEQQSEQSGECSGRPMPKEAGVSEDEGKRSDDYPSKLAGRV